MKRNLLIQVMLLSVLLVAMAAQAAPAYRYEDVVSNPRGDVIGGATVTVYIAGTDSLASLYSDPSASASYAKANPTYTDVYGRFFFYVVGGTYDVKISGYGIVTYTVEDADIGSAGYGVASGLINVKDYGAIGDAVTDDTDAIQAAIYAFNESEPYNELSDKNPASSNKTELLYFPPGDYLVTSSLWMGVRDTLLAESTYKNECNRVMGYGAKIIGRTSGTPVIDMTGNFGTQMSGLTIMGSITNSPNIGILMARAGTDTVTNPSAGRHSFINVNLDGRFTLSSVYWYGSEVNSWTSCDIQNSGGIAALYLTSNNNRQKITSSNAYIDTTYQSSYGDTYNNCNIRWYGAEISKTDSLRANVIIESLSYGPKFYQCYFNPATGAADSVKSPFIRCISAMGETGTSATTQGLSIVGSTFENAGSSLVRIENKVVGLVISDCSGGVTLNGNIYIKSTGSLYAYEVQDIRGESGIVRMSFENYGILDARQSELSSTDDLDDFHYKGEYSWTGSIPANAPNSDYYKLMVVEETAVSAQQTVTGSYLKGSSFTRWYNRTLDTWGDWYQTGKSTVITTVSASTGTVTSSTDIVNVTYTATGAVSVSIPSTLVANAGMHFMVKDAGGGAATNTITIYTTGAELIDGAATTLITNNYGAVSLYSDGTNWFVY